ncbi:unnamed protein product [Symbiodinium sp. CCMP2592]|nr:unnamed protein product [Symbiodinium sp. CCMP2592]
MALCSCFGGRTRVLVSKPQNLQLDWPQMREHLTAHELRQQGIFRSATGVAVLSGCGRVWSASTDDALCDVEGTQATEHVDVFVSHSWTADRWTKHLAMCFFLNFGLAVKATLAAVMLSQCIFHYFPEEPICVFLLVLDFPIFVFFLAFFFAQHLTGGRWCPSLWVDRLCIDQQDLEAKQLGIAAVPMIVANSSQLLVLHSETYFQRLWCNLELSIFAKQHGVKKMNLVPLWLAPWLLSTMLLLYLEGRLLAVMLALNPQMGIAASEAGLNASMSPLAYGFQHMLSILGAAPFYAVLYLPLVPVSLTAFQAKLHSHATLLGDMESFDIRAGKCSVEQDRQSIEQQVAEVFDDHEGTGNDAEEETTSLLVPSGEAKTALSQSRSPVHERRLEAFNIFVRGPLRDAIIEEWGLETQLPWHICLLAWLPTLLCLAGVSWSSLAFYDKMGFTSLGQYILVSTVEIGLCYPLCLPLAHPCCLRCLRSVSCFSQPWLRNTVSSLGCIGVLVCVEAVAEILTGSLESFAFTAHWAFLAIFLLTLSLSLLVSFHVFVPAAEAPSSRGVRRG